MIHVKRQQTSRPAVLNSSLYVPIDLDAKHSRRLLFAFRSTDL